MTRWIRQRTGSSCGPVAILNLLKWLGEPVSYEKNFRYYKKKCDCNRYGTALQDFVAVLYGLNGIKITPRSVPNLGVIDEALSHGKAVVMKCAYIEKDELIGHYFLITERTEKSFYCVNLNYKHGWVSKASFRNQCMQYFTHYCHQCGVAPYCWIIRPE
jgi:hypothetical protein